MDREAFLERLRSHPDEGEGREGSSSPAGMPHRRALGACERLELFVDRLHELGVGVNVVASWQLAREAIEQLVVERGWESVACAPCLSWQGIAEQWTVEARDAEFGLSEADWAVAETGTVVVKSSAQVRRGYSLLPPTIGVIVPEGRLREALSDVLHDIASDERPLPGCVTFISGPSNTADIASVKVIGVHGPREVLVWVIADGPSVGAQLEEAG
jgi:hypothetical protein